MYLLLNLSGEVNLTPDYLINNKTTFYKSKYNILVYKELELIIIYNILT